LKEAVYREKIESGNCVSIKAFTNVTMQANFDSMTESHKELKENIFVNSELLMGLNDNIREDLRKI